MRARWARPFASADRHAARRRCRPRYPATLRLGRAIAPHTADALATFACAAALHHVSPPAPRPSATGAAGRRVNAPHRLRARAPPPALLLLLLPPPALLLLLLLLLLLFLDAAHVLPVDTAKKRKMFAARRGRGWGGGGGGGHLSRGRIEFRGRALSSRASSNSSASMRRLVISARGKQGREEMCRLPGRGGDVWVRHKVRGARAHLSEVGDPIYGRVKTPNPELRPGSPRLTKAS